MATTMTDAQKAAKYDAQKAKERRYWAAQQIVLAKAKDKGIVATPAEVDAYVKLHYTK